MRSLRQEEELRRQEEEARKAAEEAKEQGQKEATTPDPRTGPAWLSYVKEVLGLSGSEQEKAEEAQARWQDDKQDQKSPPEAEAATIEKPKPPSIAEEVAAVRSLNTEFKDQQVKAVEAQLAKAMARRQKQIQAAFDAVNTPEFMRQGWAQAKAASLKADLDRPLASILTTPDCAHVDKGLRDDILKHHRQLERARREVLAAKQSFMRFNMQFVDPRVDEVLRGTGITPAELKALVAQESGDFTMTDRRGDIAGPAQIGRAEAREVGADPKGRLDPEKAILLSAKVLRQKVEHLKSELKHGVPAGDDYKKFVFASYNAGARTIRRAQEAAVDRGLDPLSWDALISGGARDSALTDGIKAALPGMKSSAKYKETTDYVERIFKRLEGLKDQS